MPRYICMESALTTSPSSARATACARADLPEAVGPTMQTTGLQRPSPPPPRAARSLPPPRLPDTTSSPRRCARAPWCRPAPRSQVPSGSGACTVWFFGLLPASRPASRLDAPSTSTSTVLPKSRWFASKARFCTRSTRRSNRPWITSRGVAIVDRRGRRALALRIDEREHLVVAHLVHKAVRVLEVLRRLAGESDDDVGGQRDLR